jgi:two-component system, NtrC family, response regulator AtoC
VNNPSQTYVSNSHPTRILVAEDESEIRDYLQLALRRPNVVIDFAENGEEVMSLLGQGTALPALVILDVAMPRKDGISTLREIRQRHPALPIIMLSGLSSTVNIVDAMKLGANDFLTKPVPHEVLRQAVDQLLSATALNGSIAGPHRESTASRVNCGNWSLQVERLLERIAASDVPVLLQGETGSGKEVLARSIHAQSLRSGEVFLKLNCAALPSELIESELFGYERGAFTGAFKSNPGKFELANNGTIFLDEIGDMDLKLQAKLLQVLQDQEFLRLGAKEPTRVNVRVIAATHRDLELRITEGAFREDLYYRLNIVRIEIPPLRDRPDEIIPLGSHFLTKHHLGSQPVPGITKEMHEAMLNHRWPGNIRELENLMRQYLVVRDPDSLVRELRSRAQRESRLKGIPVITDFPNPPKASTEASSGTQLPAYEVKMEKAAAAAPPQASSTSEAAASNLEKVDQARRVAETEVIVQALNSTLWNRKKAAAELGTDYKALLYKMKKLGIG